MTGRTKRSLEKALDELKDSGAAGEDAPDVPAVVYDTSGEYLDMDGEPAPTNDDGNLVSPSWGATVVFEAVDVESAPAPEVGEV
jgi:hypothetical protein